MANSAAPSESSCGRECSGGECSELVWVIDVESQEPECLIAGRYSMSGKIAAGTFSHIFLGKDKLTGEKVAVKFENKSCPERHRQLAFENKLLRALRKGGSESGPGDVVPRVEWFGEVMGFRVMVMELLGPSLEDVFNSCSRKFSTKTILMLAMELIDRLEYLHSKSFLHRDVKPENFVTGKGADRNKIYMIDFGLSKAYRDLRSKTHCDPSEGNELVGTPRYISIGAHQGCGQSRRDDLESLGYVLLYFNRGSLPWQDLQGATSKQKHDKIKDMKLSTSVEVLSKGYPFEAEFNQYMKYCKGMKYAEEPNYKFLKELFRVLLADYDDDRNFDWALRQEQEE